MKEYELPLDVNGNPFSKPTFWLMPGEYSKIITEINQAYEALYKGKVIASHPSFGLDGEMYIYWFENHGFNNYNIFMRVVDDH